MAAARPVADPEFKQALAERAEAREVGETLASSVLLLSHITQTLAVMQSTCLELADQIRSLVTDPGVLARLVMVKAALTAQGPAYEKPQPSAGGTVRDLTYEPFEHPA